MRRVPRPSRRRLAAIQARPRAIARACWLRSGSVSAKNVRIFLPPATTRPTSRPAAMMATLLAARWGEAQSGPRGDVGAGHGTSAPKGCAGSMAETTKTSASTVVVDRSARSASTAAGVPYCSPAAPSTK